MMLNKGTGIMRLYKEAIWEKESAAKGENLENGGILQLNNKARGLMIKKCPNMENWGGIIYECPLNSKRGVIIMFCAHTVNVMQISHVFDTLLPEVVSKWAKNEVWQ